MTPSVGRIIHVVDRVLETCIAGIINKVEDDKTFSCTIFPFTGPIADSAKRLSSDTPFVWHDPRECPND